MERFAFKIDAALKANLYKICRLCGIDNPSKVPILPDSSDVIDLDEPSLSQKVLELIGFMVAQNDKMPQTMCSLCVDKINDFYEFREMCFATNNQTRKLLGLKKAEPQKIVDIKPIFKSEPQTVAVPAKRGRKRKTDDSLATIVSGSSVVKSSATEIALDAIKYEPLNWRKKQRLQQLQLPANKTEVKEEPTELDKLSMPMRKARKASCSVCGERFENKELADEHKTTMHVPMVMRYSCNACNQSHHSLSDIKAHQLWHKLSKTPYQCPLCDANIANNYAYTRHLREHTLPTPIELLVLDRECPLCRKTFLTNFFYNTHPCARRTRQCGGCNRLMSTESAYMRHAPHCAKIYLNHSKHIMPEAADNEAQVRIKNENDVEDNAQASIAYTPAGDMQPVVVLERLESPQIRTPAANSIGRTSDRVSSKNYLKRVDQLLKNAMSTLVSIKHEPEVHIDDTGPPLAAEQHDSEPEEEPPPCDDFHADDSDEDAASGTFDAATVAATVTVKQERIDESYEKQPAPSCDGVQIKQEPLKLKLKITKNHGQLNSSLVDDDNEVQSRSAKKKKKRKHKERNKESESTSAATADDDCPRAGDEAVAAADSAIVSIKQERLDSSYADTCAAHAQFEPQATVMTSIPMLQLEDNYSDANQESANAPEEPEDVKPNRLELDRIMQITHIASGVVLAEEAMPPESAVEAVPHEMHVKQSERPAKSKSTKSTARKSTGGGMPREVATSSNSTRADVQLPQIVAVESVASVPFNLATIKPEPLNLGYADEHELQDEPGEAQQQQPADETNEINHNEKLNEESAYINSLDLSNVIIKQERDLHISDVDINDTETANIHFNGVRHSEHSADDDDEGDEDDDDDDGSASSADEAEEHMDTYEEQEERIYREIELPPLEEQSPVKSTTSEAQRESDTMSVKPQSVGQSEMLPVESEVQSEMKSVESQSVVQLEEPLNEDQAERQPEILTVEPPSEVQETSPRAAEEENLLLPQEEPPNMPQESQPELSSEDNVQQPQAERAASEPKEPATAFNFVITSVCSQAAEHDDEANGDNMSQMPAEKPEKSDENESPVVTLSAPKETETQAQPFSTNYNCAEERQNVLNHELSASGQQEQANETEVQPEAAAAPTSCLEAHNADEDGRSANEETENRINEQQQEQQQQQQVQQQQEQVQPQEYVQPPRCPLNDDSNINEIAENNNNANIERELNDDANVAQENPIP